MSDLRLSLASVDCGAREVDTGDTTLNAQREYENVDSLIPTTQAADSLVARTTSRKLSKKPKPGPKPNYVAVRVAELNLKHKIILNETSFQFAQTKLAQHGCPGPTPERPAVEKSCNSTSTNSELASDVVEKLTDKNISWSDDPVYDTAVRVEHNVAISADEPPEKYSVRSTTANSDEEPIYDEAILVVASEADEPLYEEAAVVQADRLQSVMCDESEPLYAEPDDIFTRRSHAASTEQYSDEESFLYEEALPVDNMTIPSRGDGATATNC